jgi:hypothetical protein
VNQDFTAANPKVLSLPGLTRQSMSGCCKGSRASMLRCVTVWAPASSAGVTTTLLVEKLVPAPANF